MKFENQDDRNDSSAETMRIINSVNKNAMNVNTPIITARIVGAPKEGEQSSTQFEITIVCDKQT